MTSPVVSRVGDVDALRGARLIDLELPPLAEADAEMLARTLLDPRKIADIDAFAREVARESRGEPLAVVRSATSTGPIDVSEPADDEVLRHIRALGADSTAVLALATVASDRLANDLARAVLELGVTQFEVAARELVAAGLLAAVALESAGVLKLARTRIAELVRVELDADREATLHVRLAEVLAASGAEAELIAKHFETGGDTERALSYLIPAAQEAADALAFVRAEQLYRRALMMSPTQALALKRALADQLCNLGRSPEAAELYAEVANLSPQDEAAKLRLKAAEQYAVSGWSKLALALLRELLRDAGEPLPTSLFGAVVMYVRNRWQLARFGRREWRRASSDISPEALAHFELVYSALIALSRSQIVLSAALMPRVALLALVAGDPTRVVVSRLIEITFAITSGRFDAASGRLKECEAIAEDPLARAYVHVGWHHFHARRAELERADFHFDQALTWLGQHRREDWVKSAMLQIQSLTLRQSGEYERLHASLPAWIDLLRSLGQHQTSVLLIAEEVLGFVQRGDLQAARRSFERARMGWNVDYYNFVDYLRGIAEIWLLLGEGHTAQACELAQRIIAEMRQHGHSRLKLPRTRVQETYLYARTIHAVASGDLEQAPRSSELRKLRRSGVPFFRTTALILMAGRASLFNEREHEHELWREAVRECDATSMRAYAAASRLRLAALGVEDAVELEVAARAYFEREKIGDVPRCLALLTPARDVARLGPGPT